MPRFILNVFLVIVCAAVMVVLYEVLFSTDTDGVFNVTKVFKQGGEVGTSAELTGKQRDAGIEPDGVLWQVAHNIQKPISRYYYKYVYVPYKYADSYVDAKLNLHSNATADEQVTYMIDMSLNAPNTFAYEGGYTATDDSWGSDWVTVANCGSNCGT